MTKPTTIAQAATRPPEVETVQCDNKRGGVPCEGRAVIDPGNPGGVHLCPTCREALGQASILIDRMRGLQPLRSEGMDRMIAELRGMADEVLNKAEAARFLRMSTAELDRLLKSKDATFRYRQRGRYFGVLKSELVRWVRGDNPAWDPGEDRGSRRDRGVGGLYLGPVGGDL